MKSKDRQKTGGKYLQKYDKGWALILWVPKSQLKILISQKKKWVKDNCLRCKYSINK